MIVSMHPRASSEEQSDAMEARSRVPRQMFGFNESALEAFPSSEALLDGVDIVISGYSTTNLYGILKGMEGVVYAATPLLAAKFQAEKHLDVPPEVSLGSGWIVHDKNDLIAVINELQSGLSSAKVQAVRDAQQRMGMPKSCSS
eukprot:scaffold377_cov563-Prasinococcus_capsulatus_cf.AAC.24